MSTFDGHELIFEWNPETTHPRAVSIYDETLRDGIQSPTAVDPDIDTKKRILELMDAVGIETIDVGLPGAGARAVEDVTSLVHHIQEQKLALLPSCAARTHAADIQAIIDISQDTGCALEVMAFLGSSPIRKLVEDWDDERLESLTRDAVRLGVKEGLPVTFVTEDTIRSRPETLERLFKAAVDEGAKGLCLCDTVGHAVPGGVRHLLGWTRELLETMGTPDIVVDWHGHNDRGLGVINAIAAAHSGADRVHGTVLGIGERVGNTATDQLMVNLNLLGTISKDLTQLGELCTTVAKATETELGFNYPIFGRDAFRTATGVHAAAVVKALNLGDDWLADRIYSGVPAGDFGLKQVIDISHMSGKSNAEAWLKVHGYEASAEIVNAVLAKAKSGDRTLTNGEIHKLIEELG